MCTVFFIVQKNTVCTHPCTYALSIYAHRQSIYILHIHVYSALKIHIFEEFILNHNNIKGCEACRWEMVPNNMTGNPPLHKESYDLSGPQMNDREEFNHIISLSSWIQDLDFLSGFCFNGSITHDHSLAPKKKRCRRTTTKKKKKKKKQSSWPWTWESVN